MQIVSVAALPLVTPPTDPRIDPAKITTLPAMEINSFVEMLQGKSVGGS